MNKLRQEYIIQVRNTLFAFLHKHVGMTVDVIGEIFGVDKSTVSRSIRGDDVDKRLLVELTKYFK